MLFAEVIPTIKRLSQEKSLAFSERAANIGHLLDSASTADVLDHLARAHVIPECLGHDTTEEKLFAKYLDTLLARALGILGLSAEVVSERARAADVIAGSNSYRVVGDAKAFRLSRTAKNQKDFKVGALDTWRNGAEYATLCGPLYQYPSANSQIYEQAIRYNVTLISYSHLGFLIDSGFSDGEALENLWKVGQGLSSGEDAQAYWAALNCTVCELAGKSDSDWNRFKDELLVILPQLASEQIQYLETERQRAQALSRDTAIRELIAALKIDKKITRIRRSGNLQA